MNIYKINSPLTYAEEADFRNLFIYRENKTLKSLPSYALWNECSIKQETLEERISWWMNLKEYNNKGQYYKKICNIIARINIPYIEKDSKRFTNTLWCDI